MTELKDQLSLLGRKTEYKQDYAPEVLEAFDNKHPENDYWVRFNCPEFTSLCPITGQPDFAEIRISYIPDIKMVESYLDLFQAVMELDKKYRVPVLLFYYERYSTAEIASILKIPEKTVSTRLFRAKAKLKNYLKEEKRRRTVLPGNS